MNKSCSLSQLPTGQGGRVERVAAGGSMRRRLLDIGLIPGTRVVCLARSPAGDPAAYLIRGAVIALRDTDAADVTMTLQPDMVRNAALA